MDYARLTAGAAEAIADALAGRAKGIAVSTSGSEGEPSEVLVSADAVRASAAATEAALGFTGHWVLAVPTDRIAGAMVLARASLAGSAVASVASGTFGPESLAAAADRLPSDAPLFTSLVPTQLARIVASGGTDVLRRFEAVLVGGAALGTAEVPDNVVRTYGLTETAGGCVYNGKPIGDTEVRVREDGRILIATSSLADAYSPERPDAWLEDGGRRWLVTSDLGALLPDGSLTVLGRADDIIATGGFKVHPRTVESAIDALGWVKESAVVGAPSPEWGTAVFAFVAPRATPASGVAPPRLKELRAQLEGALPRHALPTELLVIESLPRLPGGKVNYPALKATAAQFAAQGA